MPPSRRSRASRPRHPARACAGDAAEPLAGALAAVRTELSRAACPVGPATWAPVALAALAALGVAAGDPLSSTTVNDPAAATPHRISMPASRPCRRRRLGEPGPPPVAATG